MDVRLLWSLQLALTAAFPGRAGVGSAGALLVLQRQRGARGERGARRHGRSHGTGPRQRLERSRSQLLVQ